jgi:branched-chain amino acid transport system substrate-binding protein
MRSLATVLGFCALVLTLGSCGQKVSEIKVGEYGSMTGGRATFGTSNHRGIEMAIDEANTSGGIGGTPIRLISEDDQGKPEEAATAVNKLISQDRVIAILGEVASSASLAGGPVCQQNGVPMISPSSTNEKVTQIGDFIFRVCYIDPFQGMVMARFAGQSLRLTKVAILRDKRNDYSIGLANVFKETFQSLGGTITADESYQEGDMDFRAPLTAILSTGPEALFVPGYYTEVGLIARQARELGFTGPMLGGDGWVSPSLFEIAGQQLEGCFFSNHYAQDDPNPIVQQFISKFQERYKEVPDAMSALGYDAARILVHSLKGMQKTNPEAVAALLATAGNDEASRGKRAEAMRMLRDAIAATRDFPGVTGSISIDENRNAIKPIVVLKVHDGNLVMTERIAP